MTGPAIGCSACREALSVRLDATLEAPLRAQVDGHLASCEACRRYDATLRSTVLLCRAASRPEVPRDCLARAADAARAELRRRGLI